MRFLILLLATAIFPHLAVATGDSAQPRSYRDSNIWDDPDRGFYWYPDPKPPTQLSPEEIKPITIYQMTSMDDIRKELVRMRDVAILNPDSTNIHAYLKAQGWVMDKSSVFSDMARRVVWANPDIEYGNRSPVANFARLNEQQRMDRARSNVVQNLVRDDFGIVFFARSDCRYCHDQAPVLRAFMRSTGMQVLAITLDGGVIPDFPDAKRDNGISMLASGGEGVQTVPAIFLIDRKTKQMIPLGTGVISAGDLAERIRVITMTKPGEEF